MPGCHATHQLPILVPWLCDPHNMLLTGPELCCAPQIDPELWLAPALRPGAEGWWPQGGLVWEKYGLGMYTA
jgi:hypothetical protein